MYKRLLKYLCLVLLCFVFSCGNEKIDTQKDLVNIDLAKIKERGKLIALTGYNAYSYFIYRGQPMGFEYDLVKRYADDLGVDLEIHIERDITKMFTMLEEGKGDLIAFNLTVTQERSKLVSFTTSHHNTKQVLIQRRPDNWRRLRKHEIDNKLIRNPIDLGDKTVYVKRGSAYYSRLTNLSSEIGGGIEIVEAPSELSTEDLIKMVADGIIDYTVADKNVATLNQANLSNIDVETEISFPQKIAWAVRPGSPELLGSINTWIGKMKKVPDYHYIYEKYYKNRNAYKTRLKSQFFSHTGGKISEYDEKLKVLAKKLSWDWRILASLIYQESQFKPKAKSWAGAVGLMQLMPATAKSYGAENPEDPNQSLAAGIKYLQWLDKYWTKQIPDQNERIKFVLASYNIGFGHIIDAMKLADKYGAESNIWFDNVEKYLLFKSNPKYYNDEVVKNGYCRGIETVKYVEEVLDRFNQYKKFVGLESLKANYTSINNFPK